MSGGNQPGRLVLVQSSAWSSHAILLAMCDRYASDLPPEAIRALFRTVNPLVNTASSWNVAPIQTAIVIQRHTAEGVRHFDLLRWGLVPGWTQDLKCARKPINARSETASGSGMFKAALATRRCLVPVDAFYEWRAMPDGKQTYAIARRDGGTLAMASI